MHRLTETGKLYKTEAGLLSGERAYVRQHLSEPVEVRMTYIHPVNADYGFRLTWREAGSLGAKVITTREMDITS